MNDPSVDLHTTNGYAMTSTAALLLTLTWISVALRSYTRCIIMKTFNLDDWLMVVSQLIFTVSCAFVIVGVHTGMGTHNAAIVDDNRRVQALMFQALATASYVLDMMFIKLSIGIFLLRLTVQRVYRYIIGTALAVIPVWTSVLFLWDVFQCHPVAKQWDYRITGGKCVAARQVVAAAYAISVMTILSDWLFALLPIPMLWNVKMTKQAKITVIAILGLGIFASIATLVRIRFLVDLENTNDLLFAGTESMVWTLIEPGVAIIASSLATIRPLLRTMRVRGFESADATRAPQSCRRRRHPHSGRSPLTSPRSGKAISRDRCGGPVTRMYGMESLSLDHVENLAGLQSVTGSNSGGDAKGSESKLELNPANANGGDWLAEIDDAFVLEDRRATAPFIFERASADVVFNLEG